jgi:hypothetical protein
MNRRLLSIASLLLITALAVSMGSRPAESATVGTQVIYVDQSDPHANDSNPGTASRPLETIGRAVEVAASYNARSVPVRVIVRAGIYRESVQLIPDEKTTSAPLTIEGKGSGVVVSGSDVWADWIGGSDGIYSHPWPYQWGLASVEDWPEHVLAYLDANPVISRREMVFVDEAPLLQVMSLDETKTTENSFFVSEEADQLFINVPSETDMATTQVEVAVRPSLLLIGSRRNVSIENITFQHAPNGLDEGAAVVVANSANVSVISSRFIWNNGSGLGLFEDTGVSIRDTEASHNGLSGFTGFRVRDLLVLDSEASFNGWRGSRGWNRDNHDGPIDLNFIDFATGQKFFGLRHASFQNYRAVGNLTGGLWLDYDNSDVHIENAVLKGNLTHGLMVEASQGPVSVERSQICGNETGILVNSSSNARVVGNVIAGNLLGQFVVVSGRRAVLEHDTGDQITVQAENWVVRGNQIAVNDGQLAISTYFDGDLWSAYIETLDSGDNRYSSPRSREVFQLPGGRNVTLEEWKAETGTDAGSTFSLGESDCPTPVANSKASPLTPGLWVAAALAGLGLLALGILRLRR